MIYKNKTSYFAIFSFSKRLILQVFVTRNVLFCSFQSSKLHKIESFPHPKLHKIARTDTSAKMTDIAAAAMPDGIRPNER